MISSVSLLYSGSATQLQGVNAFMKNFLYSRKEMEGFGYRINSLQFSDQAIATEEANEQLPIPPPLSTGWTRLRKALIGRSAFLDFLAVKKRILDKGGVAVEQYLNGSSIDDCVIFNDFITAFHFFKRVQKSARPRTVLIVHASEEPLAQLLISYPKVRGNKHEAQLRAMLTNAVENADAVVAISEKQGKAMRDFFNREINVIHNGLRDLPSPPIQRLAPGNPIKLVMVGSLCHRKGQDIAISALAESHALNLELHLVGDGNMRESLESLVRQRGIQGQVHFHGAKTSSEVAKILAEMDYFLLSSRDEGIPIAILEAMRAALPVISTKVGGIPEMIPPEAGILVAPEIDAVRDAMLHISSLEPSTYQDLSAASRALFEDKFSNTRMMQNYAGVLDAIPSPN